MIVFTDRISPDLAPLSQNVGDIRVGNRPIKAVLAERLGDFSGVWPVDRWLRDDRSVLEIRWPWHVLEINEEYVGGLDADDIRGEVSARAEIRGRVRIGEGTELLPGVFIEGNVIIGDNCKIGPNCYIRGNTVIGDDCHVGQGVEIKNSVLGNRVSAGHLSYIGDSVIDDRVNLGAGFIVGNLRHDGRFHRWRSGNGLIDTGRRKFGTVIGRNVHTGIGCRVYPGRKIYSNCDTLPGEIIIRDRCAGESGQSW